MVFQGMRLHHYRETLQLSYFNHAPAARSQKLKPAPTLATTSRDIVLDHHVPEDVVACPEKGNKRTCMEVHLITSSVWQFRCQWASSYYNVHEERAPLFENRLTPAGPVKTAAIILPRKDESSFKNSS